MNLDNFNSLIELFFYQAKNQDPKSIFLKWLNPNNKKTFTWEETKLNITRPRWDAPEVLRTKM